MKKMEHRHREVGYFIQGQRADAWEGDPSSDPRSTGSSPHHWPRGKNTQRDWPARLHTRTPGRGFLTPRLIALSVSDKREMLYCLRGPG